MTTNGHRSVRCQYKIKVDYRRITLALTTILKKDLPNVHEYVYQFKHRLVEEKRLKIIIIDNYVVSCQKYYVKLVGTGRGTYTENTHTVPDEA